ncbi:MAG: tRNA dihydrouridine synthase DusB [Clostridiales bacterium]|nr:tRNA dihydrouridine synthase DusB [Clostridiales bacterium]
MKIGNIVLPRGLALAPMAGVADTAFRIIAREYGAEYCVTEMISAKGIHYNDKKTPALAALTEKERPAGIQIFGSEPEIMAKSALRLAKSFTPEAIDINMGCPVRKIAGNREGAYLMRDIPLACEIVKAVRASLDSTPESASIPLTAKIRTGWNASSINAPDMAAALEEAGAAALCIHGRTREQQYLPPVDHDTIAAVKRAVKIPVFGNGGIMNGEDALRMFDTGVDGIMVARGAVGRPWIFAEINAALDGKFFREPSTREIIDTAKRHLALLVESKGEFTGIREARRQIAAYLSGFNGAAGMRADINRAETSAEILSVLDRACR